MTVSRSPMCPIRAISACQTSDFREKARNRRNIRVKVSGDAASRGIETIGTADTVFLSYSSEDAGTAQRICDALRSAGLGVWFDQSELRGGDVWDAAIRDQIRNCAAFVPIISASTQKREEGYFRLEWKLAIDRSHFMAEDKAFFFPVVIDEIEARSARVPEKFRQLQWTRLGDDGAMEDFAALVRGTVVRDVEAAVPATMAVRRPSGGGGLRPADRPLASTEAGFRIAVLPFKRASSDPDLDALAEGFAEDIIAGLSRFSYLKVMAHGATLGLVGDRSNVGELARQLLARYLMVGSLRRAGTAIRLSAQLVDAHSGVSLWAERYDRQFSPASAFELLDELVPRIVSTIADMNGVLPRSLSESVGDRAPDQLTPYEALLSSFQYFWQLTPDAFSRARSRVEAALAKAPRFADAWAMLANLCGQAYGQRFDPDVDFLSIAEAAARKAVDLAPSNHMTHFSLAQALFFRKDFESFRNAALKAAELNPVDGNVIAFLGELLAYCGELTKGQELAARAKQLNPHHPRWYWFTDFFVAFRRREYRQAVGFGRRIDLPDHWAYHFMMASAYGWLGESSAAASAVAELQRLRPDCAATLQDDFARWFDPQYADQLAEGLRKAGLEVA